MELGRFSLHAGPCLFVLYFLAYFGLHQIILSLVYGFPTFFMGPH